MFEYNSPLQALVLVYAVEAFVKRHLPKLVSAVILSLRLIGDLVSDTYWGWSIAWIRALYVGAIVMLVLAVVSFALFDIMSGDTADDRERYESIWAKMHVISAFVFAGWFAEGMLGHETVLLIQLIAMTGIMFAPLLIGPMLFARIGDPRQGMVHRI